MTWSLLPILPLLQAGPAATPLTGFLFQLAAISAIIYFLMIRPQQKQRKAHEERLRNLKRGDVVVTVGGVVGEIVHMKDAGAERSLDDQLTIKSADSRILIERGRIAKVLGENASSSPNA